MLPQPQIPIPDAAGNSPIQAQQEYIRPHDEGCVCGLCCCQLVLLWGVNCRLLGLWKRRRQQCHLQYWTPQVDGCYG